MCLNKATCGKVSKMNPTHKIETTEQTKRGNGGRFPEINLAMTITKYAKVLVLEMVILFYRAITHRLTFPSNIAQLRKRFEVVNNGM